MAKSVGLRTEIIVNLILLMGAALLFSGFLLLNFAERLMLSAKVDAAQGQLEVVARLLATGPDLATLEPDQQGAIRLALAGLADNWTLTDGRQQVVLALIPPPTVLRPEDLQRARLERQTVTTLTYETFYLAFAVPAQDRVTVTVPILDSKGYVGALQGEFSLAGVKDELARAARLYLLYVVFYGGILLLFGLWLLGKTVVRPVRDLMAATRRVADGDLERTLLVAGPREIEDLATAFNKMTEALCQSREQTAVQIRSLEETNLQLGRAQDQLIRSEKLASVGRLAAGMAHEIGNPLGAVVGYLEFLKADADPTLTQEVLGRALGEAQRIDRLVRDLLDYAASGKVGVETFDPAPLLVEASDLLVHQGMFETAALSCTLPSHLPSLRMVRHQLLQVVVNLLLNARDAAPTGWVELAAGQTDKSVWITVADDGTGMCQETLSRVFDPFFSTKDPGKGRGLGLSVCHRIVEEAGGSIEVKSTPGAGSLFRVILPQAAEENHV